LPKWGEIPVHAEVQGATYDSQAGALVISSGDGVTATPPLGVYSTPILYTAAAIATAGSFVYLLRNGTKTLSVTEIVIDVGFQATTAAASSSDVEIVTLTGVTADALGTLYSAAKHRASYPNSGTVCRSNGVVTATGGVVERTIARVGKARSNGSTSRFDLDPTDECGFIRLEPGIGNALALRLNAAAVIGDTIRGWVTWQET
jgi:hypothetical protein